MSALRHDDVAPVRSWGASRVRSSRAGGSLRPPEAALHRLQQCAGNHAVAASVQRDGLNLVKEEDDEEKVPGSTQADNAGDIAAPAMAGIRSGLGGPSAFTGNDTGAQGGGPDIGGDISAALRIGTLGTEFARVGTAAKKVHENRKKKKEAKDASAAASLHLAERNLKVGGGDIAEKGASIPATLLKAGTKIAALAGHSNVAVTVSGNAVALPAQLYSTGRSIRQADRARRRWRRLKELSETQFEDPATLLQHAEDFESKTLDALLETEDRLYQLKFNEQSSGGLSPAELDARTELTAQREALEQRLQEAGQATREATALCKTTDDLRTAITNRYTGATTAPTLAEIVEYAKAKQKRGLIRKAITAVGGSLSVTASAVAIAAGIATAAAFVLTPVGWGVAVLAGAVGMGVVGYKGVQRFRKFAAKRRMDAVQEGKVRSRGDKVKDFGRNLRDTFTRKKAPSDREPYAKSLLKYYRKGTPNQQEEAERTIIALLGIENSSSRQAILRDMKSPAHKEDSITLLAAKMAS